MTNTELIQKIRAEIERRTYGEQGFNSEDAEYGYRSCARDLLSFLSTLESEKPMNPDDAMKALNEKIALVKQRGTWDGVDVDKYMDEVRGREPEKPMVQKGLDVTDFCKPIDPGIAQCIADHSWEMLGEDEKSVPNDLEEAARKHSCYDEDCEGAWYEPIVRNAFIAGAEWQAKQMLKEAVEGIVHPDDCEIWVNFVGYGYKFNDGDKVRIIVLPKEDKK